MHKIYSWVLNVFIHKETLEVVSFLDEDRFPDMEAELWQDAIDMVNNNRKKYLEVLRMNSSDEYQIMEAFVHTKSILLEAIEGKKPFANFKRQIDNSVEYRASWFAFSRQKNMEWVEKQLRAQLR